MIEAKKNERANALREVKDACKEFGFTVGMLKGAGWLWVEVRNEKVLLLRSSKNILIYIYLFIFFALAA